MGAVVVLELVDSALLVLLVIRTDSVAVLVAAAFGKVVLDVGICAVVGPGAVFDVLTAAVVFTDDVLNAPGAGAGVVVLDVLAAAVAVLDDDDDSNGLGLQAQHRQVRRCRSV